MNSFQRAHHNHIEAPTLPAVRTSRNGTETKRNHKDNGSANNNNNFGADVYLQDSNRYRGRVKELFGKGAHSNQSKLKNIVGV